MKVLKSELCKLFTALGLPDTESLPEEKFEAKVKRMSKYTPEDGADAINPVALAALFEKVVKANAAVETVDVEDDLKKKTAKKPAAAAEPAKGAAKKKPAKTEAEPTPKKKPKKPGRKATAEGGWTPDKGPLPFADGGSVIKTIVEILTKAGDNGKPLTKDAIHEKMKKIYPDRDAKKMFTTMSNQVPSRLRIVRRIHVWKTSKTAADGTVSTAYWIENGGKKPQPETKQEKKEVNKKKADDGKSEAEVAAAAAKKKKKPAAE